MVEPSAGPDQTAVRVALWRAQHVQIDAPPHVLDDLIGLRMAAPPAGWQNRPDMHPVGTRPFRASIVGRARFIEDLVGEQASRGVSQYVILGAGLDSFAQRRLDIAAHVRFFEVDQPGTQAWKQRRLAELGLPIPPALTFVPVNFEAGDDWWEKLGAAGFDRAKPAVVASTGVSMYLTKEAIAATLRQVATLATGSTYAMTFMVPMELVDAEIRPFMEFAVNGARASGTPFISFFAPDEIVALALNCGFRDARHVSGGDLAQRYFAGRSDELRPANNAEDFLIATT